MSKGNGSMNRIKKIGDDLIIYNTLPIFAVMFSIGGKEYTIFRQAETSATAADAIINANGTKGRKLVEVLKICHSPKKALRDIKNG